MAWLDPTEDEEKDRNEGGKISRDQIIWDLVDCMTPILGS